MPKKKLQPRNIVKVCSECGHDRWCHREQSLRDPIDFADGKSVYAYKMFCAICRKECGLSNRIGLT